MSRLVSFFPLLRRDRPLSPLHLAAWATLWMMVVGNLTLWRALLILPELQGGGGFLRAAGLMAAFGLIQFAFISLFAWPRLLKPLLALLLVCSAAASYFMLSFGVVIDSNMMINVIQTDVGEARDLLSGALVLALLGIAVVPVLLFVRRPLTVQPWPRRAGRNLAAAGGALGLAVVLVLVQYQSIASLMRNHKPLRYQIAPANVLIATGKALAQQLPQAAQPLVPIGEDVHSIATTASGPGQAGPLLVIVVGETARAANATLAGYARDTQPQIRARVTADPTLAFRVAQACGTSTEVSLPCMFSHLDGPAWRRNDTRYENLLDVARRAGLAVLWVDNQSGCKGVCERVASVSTKPPSAACPSGNCQDRVMLEGLDARLAALDPARRQRGTVLVLHQMGSHGPAYYQRAAPANQVFQPACATRSLSSCRREEIVNAYDNSLRETDAFLAQTYDWLARQHGPRALIYASDHGESLGEYGLYLHGMPYALAPQTQKQVPMLLWRSPELAQRRGAAAACTPRAGLLSHDFIFHTTLGLLGLQTRLYQPALDAWASCDRTLTAAGGVSDRAVTALR